MVDSTPTRRRYFFADTDDYAVEEAKTWAHSFVSTPEDAWLQVAMSGKGIFSLRPGEF
jgi:hypothetical protein